MLETAKIISTSPTAKMASLTLYEYFIQRKEMQDFNLFTLQDVEKVFEKVELVSFNEHRRIRSSSHYQIEDQSEIILSAHPSGSAIGGTCWKIEYNKQTIIYAVDLNDVPLTISVPMMRLADFKNANIMITNTYHQPKAML
jgi:cleavage and polyadenylation specificity factor subunit 2